MFQITNLIDLTWLWWIAIFTILFSFVYHCVIRYWSFFSDRNVKFIRGMPFFGSTYKIFFGMEAMSDAYETLYKKYPDESVIGMYELGGGPVYMIRDPEMIKQMAIKDFDYFVNHRLVVNEETDSLVGKSMFLLKDQKWKDMRATLSPAFTGNKMRLTLDLVTECADEFCDSLKNEIEDKAVVCDANDLFTRFASDTIATTAFGLKINSLEDKENDFYKTGLAITNFEGLKGLIFLAYSAIPKVMNYLKIKHVTEKDTSYLRHMVHTNMNYREQHSIFRPDLINLLIEARKGIIQHGQIKEIDDHVGYATVQESDGFGKSSRKLLKWEDDDFTAQCVLFFLAGLKTVSTGLCFMAPELALNKEIQEKLYQEIEHVCNHLNGKKLTYEVLQKMSYMDCVVSETLRRWTLLSVFERAVNKSYVLEDKNGNKIQLNAGDGVIFPSGSIHKDSKYYPNPEKFDPQRFNDENRHNICRDSYMPFGTGPRSCIASRFALMEVKSMFFYLLKNFVIERCPKTQHPIKLKKNTASTAPENGFWVQLKSRETINRTSI